MCCIKQWERCPNRSVVSTDQKQLQPRDEAGKLEKAATGWVKHVMTLKKDVDNRELRSDSRAHRGSFMQSISPGDVIVVSNCGSATASEVDYRHFWLGECQEGGGGDGAVSYKWDQASDDQLDIKKGDDVVNVRWMERAPNDHLKFTPGLEQTIDLQTILPMAVKWENEEEGDNGGKTYYITDPVSDHAVELCKKAVPTGEEAGSKKNKAKARSFTVAELQRTVEQLNAKLAEFSAPQVELPKVKSKMKKADWVQHEGEVRLAYDAALLAKQ